MPSESRTLWQPELGRKPRRDDLLELDLEGLDARGQVVGHLHGLRVAVRLGEPGSRVRARVLRRRGERVEARVEERLRPAPDAVEPRCRHFGTCGGCSYQNLAYPAQVREKERAAARLLAPLLDGGDVDWRPTVPSDAVWHYRNKMDFTFASRRWVEQGEPPDAAADFALGLHVAGWYGKVLDVRECHIQFEGAQRIVDAARELAREARLSPWDVRAHTGLLRHLVLRKSFGQGDVLAYLVTSEEARPAIDAFAARLREACPEITTLVQGVHDRPAAVAVGEHERVLWGPGTIRERLAGLWFAISPTSFFQTNTLAAERLVALVLAEAACAPGDVAYDLYCGGGALALALARIAREVWGFEVVAAAVRDARGNAAENGVRNARFVEGDVAATLRPEHPLARSRPAPDVAVVDPPRAGLHPDVRTALAALAPRRLVVVSCNLRAALEDALALREAGFALRRVQTLDLFPHTPHLEGVLTFERAGAPPRRSGGTAG